MPTPSQSTDDPAGHRRAGGGRRGVDQACPSPGARGSCARGSRRWDGRAGRPTSPPPPRGTTTPSRSRGWATRRCSSISTASASSPIPSCSRGSGWTWASAASARSGWSSARSRPEELPDIDLVLVSHAHFDHLDTPSLGAIRGRPVAVMAAETSDLLPRRAYSSVDELRWNEATKVTTPRGDALVRSIEVKHWGARVGRDTHRGYTGFIVEREGRRLLIGGDTARTDASAAIGASARSTPPSCPSAPTIRGFAITARRSRR